MWFVIVFAIEPSRYQRQTTQNIAESQTTESSCLYCDSSDVCPSVFTRWKKRIIVQNVNQRPYVYFKWTLKSSFCSHTKKKEIRCFNCSVHCLFYPLFLHPCNWTFPLSHSHSAIYFLLNSSNNWPLHYFIHARRLLLYSLTWQHIALFFNYNKGSV